MTTTFANPRDSLKRTFLISGIGHSVLLIVLVILSLITPQSKVERPVIQIRIATRLPEAPPAPPPPAVRAVPVPPKATPAPPKATPAPAPAPKKVEVKKPASRKEVVKERVVAKVTPEPTPAETPKPKETPAPTPEATPEAKTTPAPTPAATPAPTAEPTPAAPAVPAIPAGTLPAQPTAQVGTLSAQGTMLEMGPAYSQQVLFLIQRNFKPTYAPAGTTASVEFRITRDGTIQNARIKKSTGRADLDQFALRALRDTARLPPFYDNFPKPFIDVEVVFDYERAS